MNAKLENFADSFDSHFGTCRATCHCGITYWDSYNSGYSWEDGEVERLEKDPKAQAVEGSIGFVDFEGKTYVWQCECWHARANQIMSFIDGHAVAIADYLNREKKRKQQIADSAPLVS